MVLQFGVCLCVFLGGFTSDDNLEISVIYAMTAAATSKKNSSLITSGFTDVFVSKAIDSGTLIKDIKKA